MSEFQASAAAAEPDALVSTCETDATRDLFLDRGRDPTSELPARPGHEARAFANAVGVTVTFADLLLRRGHSDPDATRRFLDPRLKNLTQPEAMVDRAVASDRLASAIRRGERIAVFGDYDCDGITAAAVATESLSALGGDVVSLLANRFDGGYGLSENAMAKLVDSGARVLVTCDCGSSEHEALEKLRQRGIESIVIDHHLVPDEPLPVVAFLNPHRKECGFPYKGLASCGLALSVAAGVRAALGRELDLRNLLDLVAIGTIGDVAPLDGDNRALVRAGLRSLGEAKRPGVRALLELARLEAPITGEEVAFRIAPRLNAPGRLAAPDPALRLLLERDLDNARLLAAEIEHFTNERRTLQDAMLRDAVGEIEAQGYADRPAIVVGREGWSAGIVGIVAGRLAERYARPAIVVGFQGGVGRGSVRGPEGAQLHAALSATQGALVRFGGHQAAAGLEVRLERLDELRELFESACVSGLADPVQASARSGKRPDVVWLDPEDEPHRVLSDLARLEPCGERNPGARLAVEAALVFAREVRGGHLKLELELDRGRRVAAFGPGMADRAATLSGRIVVLGRLRPDRFRGGTAVEVRVDSII